MYSQARSQDLEKGGLFWKSEKSANDLDPNFYCSWINFTRFVRKLRRNFSESSEIQTFFRPKIRWSPKKKSTSPKLTLIFRPNSEIQTFEGGLFSYGGLFSIFHKKSASKAPKTCDFAYFTSQRGGLEPPLATLLCTAHYNNATVNFLLTPDITICYQIIFKPHEDTGEKRLQKTFCIVKKITDFKSFFRFSRLKTRWPEALWWRVQGKFP